ncbi:glycine cleavage system aminomethyltransferase GcvT [Desulfobacterota bacterium AH_259_B03_O07]|nr:glycine cleavage system aminomethyltransferase GcvT [Desulfobacterota bacterium AH_259_B03_O07]
MRHTALYPVHKQLGARLVEFADWEMPIQYSGVKNEHMAVRTSAGLFDVSHMGEIEIKGREAGSFCQWLTTNDINRLHNYEAQYTLILNQSGGVIDDVIIYRFSEENFLLCVNAINTVKVYDWMESIEKDFEADVQNRSFEFSQLALQGPDSERILDEIIEVDFSNLRRFRFLLTRWREIDLVIARTGYTGEDGFEIFIPWESAPELWSAILNHKNQNDILPCGLGSRDTLRIEMGYPLYGHEIDEDINPIEAGLSRYVKIEKGDFIGKSSILNVYESGPKRKLYGFEMIDRGIPRQGYPVLKGDIMLSSVTSGTLSPSLDKSIGMALLNSEMEIGDEINIEIRGTNRTAKIISVPFYMKNPHKREMKI